MNLTNLLDDKNVVNVANEIIDHFVSQADPSSLEVDYELKNGKMKVKYTDNAEMRASLKLLHGFDVPQPNTSYSFNAEANSTLYNIKNVVCDMIEKDEVTDTDYSNMQSFIAKLIQYINNNQDCIARIRNKIHSVTSAEKSIFPLPEIRVILFEFGHKEDYGDMIKVLHYSRYNKQLQSFVGEKKAVAKDLLVKRREFGYNSNLPTEEIYKQIIDKEKNDNNPLYDEIEFEDIKIVREAKECHLDIFVDYSPISQDEYAQKFATTETNHE